MFEWTVLFPLVFLTTSLSWYASTPFPFKLHSPLPTSILKPNCYFLIRKEGKIEKEKEVEGKVLTKRPIICLLFQWKPVNPWLCSLQEYFGTIASQVVVEACVAYAVPRNGSDGEMETTLVNFRGNCMCHGLLLGMMGTHQ